MSCCSAFQDSSSRFLRAGIDELASVQQVLFGINIQHARKEIQTTENKEKKNKSDATWRLQRGPVQTSTQIKTSRQISRARSLSLLTCNTTLAVAMSRTNSTGTEQKRPFFIGNKIILVRKDLYTESLQKERKREKNERRGDDEM